MKTIYTLLFVLLATTIMAQSNGDQSKSKTPIADKINLTESQRTQIKVINADFKVKQQKAATKADKTQLKVAQRKAIGEVLTADQAKQLKKIRLEKAKKRYNQLPEKTKQQISTYLQKQKK